MKRPRTILRWILRLLAAFAWLIAVALAALTIASRTEWGRVKMARALERKLEAILDGEVVIGHVEGALPGQVVVYGFRLYREGEPVLSVGRLELRWDILSLRRGTFHVDELRLDGPMVRTDKLAGLVKPAPESEPFRIKIDRLEVKNGHILAEGRTIEDVAIAGQADWRGQEGWVIVEEAGARWTEQELTARARARVARVGGHLIVVDAKLDTSRGWAWVPLAIDENALASFSVDEVGQGVGVLAGDTVLAAARVTRKPMQLDVRLKGDLDRQSLQARIDGRVGGTSLRGLRVEAARRGDQIGISARMGRDRLRALVGLDPLRGWAEASLHRPELDLVGRARFSRRGQTTRVGIERLTFRARRLHGVASGGPVLIGPGGALTVEQVDVATDAGRFEIAGTLGGGKSRGPLNDAKLHLHASDLDLGRLRQALALAALPQRGTLTADLHASRRGKALVFDGALTGRKLSWRASDPPLDARVHVDLRPGRLEAQAVLEAQGAGRAALVLSSRAPHDTLDARAWKRMAADDIHEARVELAGLDLATLARVVGRPGALQGTVDGVITAPNHVQRIEADLRARRLQGRDVDADLDLTWDKRGATATLVVHLSGARVGEVQARLGLPLRAPLDRAAGAPLEARVRLDGFPIDRLNRAGLVATSMTGILRGDVEVRGSARAPRFRGEARVLGLRLGTAHFYEVAVQGEGDLHSGKGRVQALQTSGGRLDADVDFARGWPRPNRISLVARAFDLSFLAALAPDTELAGRLDADLKVAGRDAPAAVGTLALHDGRAVVQGGVRRLEQIELTARFTPGRVVVEKATARAGSGSVTLAGEAALAGLEPRRFAADVTTDRLAVAAGTRVVRVDLEGRVEGQAGAEGWTIEARAKRGMVRMPRQQQGQLQKVGGMEDVVFVDAQAEQERARARRAGATPARATIHVTAPKGIRVRGPDVDARVAADLRIEAGARTRVSGTVQVMTGSTTVFDRRYEILHANAWFNGTGTDAQIDVLMAHEFKAATLFIALSGTLQKPRLKLSSDPAIYDEAQLLGFVLGGNPDDPALADRRVEDRAVGVASGLVASQVRNRLREVLPIDVLRVQLEEDPAGAQGARFEIGKWLTDDILLGYRFRSTSEEDQNTNEGTLEWHFMRRWMLEAHYGDRGVGGADLLWRKRY